MDNFFRHWIKREAVPGVPSTTDPRAPENGNGGKSGSYEERKVTVRSANAALTVSAVYRATELRMKTVAQFQPQFQRLNREGGNYVQYNYSYGKELNYLLQVEPNPLMTSMQLFEWLVYQRMMCGNGVAYLERDRLYGSVKKIWPCTSVTYHRFSGTYDLTYEGEYGPVDKINVKREDVIHLPNTFKTADGVWGIPTLKYAIETLSLIKTENAQALETAAKGGRTKLLIGEDTQGSFSPIAKGLFDPKQQKAYAREINREIYTQDVVSLRGLDKVQQISMSAAEMQMIEFLNMGVDDVARFWATPRALLMADANSHYTTYVNGRMEYLSNTVQPEIIEIEQEFERKLIGFDGFGDKKFHMCEQPVMRLDKEAQAKVDQLQLATGAATVNEIRKQYDKPAVENGDIVYVSTNLAELGSEKLRGNLASGNTERLKEGNNEGLKI